MIVFIDGGSRGNPGPAAAGVVVTAEDGTVLHEAALYLGEATNNVAEYRGLLAGLKAAAALKAAEVQAISDSELLVRQMTGQYRVKNAGLAPLAEQARRLARRFTVCAFRHVRREENRRADELVNQALDRRGDIGGQRKGVPRRVPGG
ncbi:MAG: ribonuclease HI family protein [Phycisphaerae bacterium]|nr:ribonuclease HI family protein [Phycisphaerae bacterium]